MQVRKLITPLLRINSFNVCRASFSTTILLKEEKVKIGKWDINYLKVGNGAHNVLCKPGALGSIWTDFKPQVEGFDRDKFTLVVWDPPGYGKSRPPERDFPEDFYERDADYAQKLMEALNIPKYSLLGWSDGGISAMILAAKYPQHVHKLVVFGSNAYILPEELEMYNKIRDVNSWSKRMRDPMTAVYGKDLFPKYWEAWSDGMADLYKKKKGDICTAELKNIKCQTLILYGQKDPMVANVHATHLHTNIVNSTLHLYPDGKHNIHLAYAEDFNKRVQHFLMQPDD